MGYYIETEHNLNKANQIFDTYKDVKIEPKPFFDPTGNRVGICVVENGPFDAAAIVFSKAVMEVCAKPDGRPKTWLSMPREEAIKACPYVAKTLPNNGNNIKTN